MVDRPIIFSAPMVRALLEGRKTQTRRLLKPQPKPFDVAPGVPCEVSLLHVEGDDWPRVALGRVIKRQEVRFRSGLRLWVREAHAILPRSAYRGSIGVGTIDQVEHPTDGYTAAVFREGFDRSGRPQWKPSIHMPRWASRLTLTVKHVRVQRLHDISEVDARDEGCWSEKAISIAALREQVPDTAVHPSMVFRQLWNDLHGPDAWAANPMVVAITFSVQRRNIDAKPAADGGAMEGSAA